MTILEIGRLCIKTKGREAGKRCVIVDIIDRNYVLVTGPKSITEVSRRRVNINHIEPLEERIKIPEGASDEIVKEALETLK